MYRRSFLTSIFPYDMSIRALSPSRGQTHQRFFALARCSSSRVSYIFSNFSVFLTPISSDCTVPSFANSAAYPSPVHLRPFYAVFCTCVASMDREATRIFFSRAYRFSSFNGPVCCLRFCCVSRHKSSTPTSAASFRILLSRVRAFLCKESLLKNVVLSCCCFRRRAGPNRTALPVFSLDCFKT